MRRVVIGALVAFALVGVAQAQAVRTLPAGAKSPPAKLDALAWLAGGRWVGEGLGGVSEEVYSPAVGGVMVGHFVQSQAGKPQFFEIMTVREEGGSLVYRLKHFGPDLKGWEEKDVTEDFPLVAIEGDRVFFSGMTSSAPVRTR